MSHYPIFGAVCALATAQVQSIGYKNISYNPGPRVFALSVTVATGCAIALGFAYQSLGAAIPLTLVCGVAALAACAQVFYFYRKNPGFITELNLESGQTESLREQSNNETYLKLNDDDSLHSLSEYKNEDNNSKNNIKKTKKSQYADSDDDNFSGNDKTDEELLKKIAKHAGGKGSNQSNTTANTLQILLQKRPKQNPFDPQGNRTNDNNSNDNIIAALQNSNQTKNSSVVSKHNNKDLNDSNKNNNDKPKANENVNDGDNDGSNIKAGSTSNPT